MNIWCQKVAALRIRRQSYKKLVRSRAANQPASAYLNANCVVLLLHSHSSHNVDNGLDQWASGLRSASCRITDSLWPLQSSYFTWSHVHNTTSNQKGRVTYEPLVVIHVWDRANYRLSPIAKSYNLDHSDPSTNNWSSAAHTRNDL